MLVVPFTCALCFLIGNSGTTAQRPHKRDANTMIAVQAVRVPDQIQRPITVTDAIRMTRLGDPLYYAGGPSKGIVAKFSPDGKHFAIVLRKGNLEQNTNEYSLLLFETADALRSPVPRTLVTLASSSNHPAIFNVAWLNDNETILFLGEHPGERTQLYSVKCSSGALERLTNHSTNLASFVNTGSGNRIVYLAESPPSSFVTEDTRRYGFHITHELLSDLMKGSSGEIPDYELFVKEPTTATARKLQINGLIELSNAYISLSPDGNYLVVQTEVPEIPGTWGEYEDSFLQVMMRHRASWGVRTRIFHYELVDTRTGASQSLLDAPIGVEVSEAAWSPDSKSVIVSDVYLPLSIDDPAERVNRKSHVFLMEIKVPSRDLVKISDKDLRLLKWDEKTNQVVCDLGRVNSLTGKPTSTVYFRKNEQTWLQTEGVKEVTERRPEIVLRENLQSAPRIFARDASTGQESLLMDLNPQFAHLAFGKVEEVKWKDTLDNEVSGGLYWPLDYVEGKRYPLVIQTHGFDPDRFWLDGPWTTAFAAQPLASKGFFVLQVPDPYWRVWGTPEEVPRAMAAYDSAIDYLDKRGLIDRDHIGIIGFSRTCFYVTYSLTHSTHKFAAATISDGINGGYFSYMALANSRPTVANEVDAITGAGAPPFGEGLLSWVGRSPPFHMDKVRTPLLIQNIGPTSLLYAWDWFSGMTRLDKPVDMVYIPEGTHVLEKPWERMVSQQGNVDWFCFWLKGEEDPDPAKAEQYARWRELRKLQGTGETGQKPD